MDHPFSNESDYIHPIEISVHKKIRIQEDSVSRPSLDSFLAYYIHGVFSAAPRRYLKEQPDLWFLEDTL